jgi:hypothetical protein
VHCPPSAVHGSVVAAKQPQPAVAWLQPDGRLTQVGCGQGGEAQVPHGSTQTWLGPQVVAPQVTGLGTQQ